MHSFRLFLWRIFQSITTQRRSRQSTVTVSEFHAAAPQTTASEGLAQVTARAEFPLPFGRKATNLPTSKYVQQILWFCGSPPLILIQLPFFYIPLSLLVSSSFSAVTTKSAVSYISSLYFPLLTISLYILSFSSSAFFFLFYLFLLFRLLLHLWSDGMHICLRSYLHSAQFNF